MANRFKLKRSSVASKVPLAADLELGELALNTADGRLFTKNGDNSIVDLGILAAERTKLAGLIKQASVSDDTAGRLMLVGGAGWLGNQPISMPSSGAINTNLKPGLYLYASSLGHTGGPESFGTVLVTSSYANVAGNGGWASQTFFGVGGQRYERYATNTSPTLPEHWSPWLVQETRPYTIAVIGDSLSTQSALHLTSWPDLLERHLNKSGQQRFRVLSFSKGGQSCYEAYTALNFGARTAAQAAVLSRPDMVILATAANDTLVGSSGRTLAQAKADAATMFTYLRNNLPSAVLCAVRPAFYDSAHGTPATLLNRQVTPFFWSRPTSGVFADSISMELGGDAVASAQRTRYADTNEYMDYVAGLAQVDHELPMDYFRIARIGGIGADALHFNSLGQRLAAGYMRKALVATGLSAFSALGVGGWEAWEDPDTLFGSLLTSSGGEWVPVESNAFVDHSDLMDAPSGDIDVVNWALRYKASLAFDRTTVPVTGSALLMVSAGKKRATLYGSLNGGSFVSVAQLNSQGAALVNLQAGLIGTGTFTVRYKVSDCIYGPLTITVT